MTNRVAVWMDHKEAHIVTTAGEHQGTVAAPPRSAHHRGQRGSGEKKEHPADAKHYFEELARALGGVEEALLMGPGSAKQEFLRFLHDHDHPVERVIVGVETVDHPTDGQIAAQARSFFERLRVG